MDIDKIYAQVKFLTRKNQQGFLRPSQFNSFWEAAERSQFNMYLGRPQAYDSKTSISQIAYEKTERLADSLLPFVKTFPLVQGTDGFAPLPADYYYIDTIIPQDSAARFRAKYIMHYRENEVANSKIRGADQSNIFYSEYPDKLKIFPLNAPPMTLVYVAEPVYGHWAFTQVGQGPMTFNRGTSTDPQWYDMDINLLIDMVVGQFGLSTKDQSLEQYAGMKNKSGD